MFNRTSRSMVWPLLVLLAASIAGCQSNSKVDENTEEYVFFPPPPAAPRIQFLTSFSRGGEVAKRKQGGSFADWLVGTQDTLQTTDAFDSPYGAAAYNGSIYICDVGLNRVHVVDFVNNEYRNLKAPDTLKNPVNITIDKDGTKYLCDTGQRMILVFDANDQFVKQIGDPQKCNPIDVAIYNDQLYVADITGGEIEVWSKDGQLIRVIGQKGVGPDEMSNPTNLDVASDGRVFVSDSMLQMVKVYDNDGNFIDTIGRPGQDIGTFRRPKGIAVDSNFAVYVADAVHDTVQIFDPQGNLLMILGEPGDKPYSMGLPAGISIDTTSIDALSKFMAPTFKADYLLIIVNQFSRHNKVAIFAYGQDTSFDPSKYQIDMEEIERIKEERKKQREEMPEDTSTQN